MDRPPLIDAEILPPERPRPGGMPPPLPRSGGSPGSNSAEPYHPAAAALLLLIDNLWMIPEFAVVDWFVTIPACFLSVFGATWWIQRHRAHNSSSMAFAKALFFGIVAAVPFSITGTPVGLAFLAWAGVRRLQR